MSVFRQRLGAWSIAWLLCQVASIAAFMPPGCCAAHETHAEEQCHEDTPADQCPMRAADGRVCPMHQAMASHASHAIVAADAAADDDCRMSGTCEGPAVALSTLISIPGILPSVASETLMTREPLAQTEAVSIPLSPVSHDTPPPKA